MVSESEISQNEDIIECKCAGCKTCWVSKNIQESEVRLTDLGSSTIYYACSLNTVSLGGFVKLAKPMDTVRGEQGRGTKNSDIIISIYGIYFLWLVSKFPPQWLKKNLTQYP